MIESDRSERRPVPLGIIGMVHLLPLPGSHRWAGSMDRVIERATADADALVAGGVDAILVENYGDAPFFPRDVPPETVASVTAAVAAIAARTALPLGINVLRNDAAAALAIAAATGGTFMRVNVHTGGMYTDQGWLEGEAAATLRLRERLAPGVAILADVLVKHATPPPGAELVRAARDAWERGWADALVVSGPGTGEAADIEDVRRIKRALPDALVLVASGIQPETIRATLREADGVIVGSALEVDGVAGRPVDPERVRRLVTAARS
jgi:uncharacterized protein